LTGEAWVCYIHPMDNSLTVGFSLSQDWIADKEAVVFGVFEGEDIPCGLGFKKETAEREARHLFPVFSAVKHYCSHKDFLGKLGETTVLYPENVLYKRVILCGLGKKDELDVEKLRSAAAGAAALVKKMNVGKISFTLFGAPAQDATARLRAIFEGVALGLYSFDAYKKEKEDAQQKIKKTEAVEFLLPEIMEESEVAEEKNKLEKYIAIAEAVYFARNLANHPASVVTPKFLAETAEALSKQYEGVVCEIFDKQKLAELGMNGILAVGGGSAHEPVLIELVYKTPEENAPTVALVGKGVCFDSGGISLKPSDGMDEMKMDMAGAAAVLGAFFTAVKSKLPVNLVTLVPAVENMPSSKSYRPGDIVKTMSGKTIEVANTDAEGRIILADALYYAVAKHNPTHLVDLATLTGACVGALGNHYAAVLGNDDALIRRLIEAGASTGEKLWMMPLDDVYKKQIESAVADVKNIGQKNNAGAITAALFLKEFIGDHKSFAHIDIAGTAMLSEAHSYRNKGGTGFGARLLMEFLENLTKRNQV